MDVLPDLPGLPPRHASQAHPGGRFPFFSEMHCEPAKSALKNGSVEEKKSPNDWFIALSLVTLSNVFVETPKTQRSWLACRRE